MSNVDPVSGCALKRRKPRFRSYPVDIVTKNEPIEVPALLSVVDDSNRSEEALLWRKIKTARTLREDEMLPKTHPARFHLFRSEKGVEETIESKEPAMPIALIHKKHHLIYEWRIHDDRGIHNSLLSDVNEYAMQSPNGRLAFYDPITEKDGLMVIVMTLVGRTREMKDADDFKEEITYGAKIPEKNAYVYATFKRFHPEEEGSNEEEQRQGEEEEEEEIKRRRQRGDPKKAKETETNESGSEEVTGSEEKENEEEEENEELDVGDTTEILKPRTLMTISVIVPLEY
jgi:hypothetical protein